MSRRTIRITASQGGYAAGRDQYIDGFSSEQVRDLLAAAVGPLERQNAEQRAEIRALSERLRSPEGIVRAALADLDSHADHFAGDDLSAKVTELVRDRQDVLAKQQERPPDPDVVLAELDRELTEAMAAGDDPRTQALLVQRRDLKLAAAARAREAAEHEEETRNLLEAAESEATLGELALARLCYREAAAHFRAAADLVPRPDGPREIRIGAMRELFEDPQRETRNGYLDGVASALLLQGMEFGDNAALTEAVSAYRSLLVEQSRDFFPQEWAATQNNIGSALAVLGEREAGTARLEESVAAYRAALEERTRERMPLVWATTQSNLGNVLETLGERKGSTVLLKESVAAFRAALEEQTRERLPLDWASIQNNLGNPLRALGERKDDTALLNESLAAYRAALKERTRKRVPLDWAMTQHNLGNLLRVLGERESGTARLEEALAAYRAALKERTRERVPLDWAATQFGLGMVLFRLGEREGGTERLAEAVAAFGAALSERTRERVPLDWADTQNHLAIALATLGVRWADTKYLEMAVTAYHLALGEFTRERAPLAWAATKLNLGSALWQLWEREIGNGTARLAEAVAAYQAALKVFKAEGATGYASAAQDALKSTDRLLAARQGPGSSRRLWGSIRGLLGR